MPREIRHHPNSLVKLRAKKGLSIKAFAKAVRLDPGTVSDLEVGRLKLHAGHINLFTKYFGCFKEDILKPCRSVRNAHIGTKHSLQNLDLGRGAARWGGKLPIPPKAHPLVRELFTLMNERGLLIKDITEATGIGRSTISEWRYSRNPSLHDIIACFNSIGFKLVVARDDP